MSRFPTPASIPVPASEMIASERGITVRRLQLAMERLAESRRLLAATRPSSHGAVVTPRADRTGHQDRPVRRPSGTALPSLRDVLPDFLDLAPCRAPVSLPPLHTTPTSLSSRKPKWSETELEDSNDGRVRPNFEELTVPRSAPQNLARGLSPGSLPHIEPVHPRQRPHLSLSSSLPASSSTSLPNNESLWTCPEP